MIPEILKKTMKFLNSIPLINRGGCGIAAALLYRISTLEESISNRHIILLYDYENEYFYKRNLERTKCGESPFFAANHIVFGFNGIYIDAKNENFNINIFPYKVECKYNELLDIIRNSSIWNYEFDRDRYLPFIDSFLSIEFKTSGLKLIGSEHI